MNGEPTMNTLIDTMDNAFIISAKYIAVKIQMQGFAKPEVIINETDNFKTKLEYYKKAYNMDLTLKAFNGIKIVGFVFGDSYNDIQNDLDLPLEKVFK